MLTLQAGESSLVLAPELGGAIVGWTLGPLPLMRRAAADAIVPGDVHGLACFPLVPYSNRIARRTFNWAGRSYTLAPNCGDHPHAIHGIGWQSVWTVEAVSRTSAVLTLAHQAVGEQALRWPFAFEAAQSFALTANTLTVELSVTNRHPEPAPVGLGLHPYFPRAHHSALRFKSDKVWQNGRDMLPAQQTAVPPEWDHAQGLAIGAVALDNCFCGWDGNASISNAPAGVTIDIEASNALRHLIIYTPPNRDFFCVEPVSHSTDAINRMELVADHSLRVLPPDETLWGKVVFRLSTDA